MKFYVLNFILGLKMLLFKYLEVKKPLHFYMQTHFYNEHILKCNTMAVSYNHQTGDKFQ